jgi:hypothetical protein
LSKPRRFVSWLGAQPFDSFDGPDYSAASLGQNEKQVRNWLDFEGITAE